MKKVLCDKDGKFISIHDEDCYLSELEDGDCLTHEDGTIVIYKENEKDPLLENMYFHAYYKNCSLHLLPERTSSFYDYANCGYRFSTSEEKRCMNNVLSENRVYYDEKEKCLKTLRWRAKIGDSYYYINFDSFEVFVETESNFSGDKKRYDNGNYFQTKEEAEKKLTEIKSFFFK